MTAVLRLKLLLTVFVAVVTANFEYDADIVDTLPEVLKYRNLVKSEAVSLEYDSIIRPEAEMRLHKSEIQYNAVRLSVDSLEDKSDKKPEKAWKLHKRLHNYHKSDKLKGLPGIKAYNVKFEIPMRNHFISISGKRRDFYFDEMEVYISQNSEGKPYLILTTVLTNPKHKRHIEIVMNLFKAPISESPQEQVNWNHAMVNKVLIIDSLIGTPDSSHSTNNDFFQFDIAHVQKVLDHVRCERSPDKYSQRCFSGPIIIKSGHQIDEILDLVDA